ncbi:winged helix-turn-helix domain-containing protein [Candidatus Marsarchaeota archaeon]|nr:winged helix-turn-helix domain-containing protein [Candidatus Marsarchaeota archaeon]MCL5404941.1 winged helix-turn-helix domain-containing protein [Candidatus Marsarchaeota archaeon]
MPDEINFMDLMAVRRIKPDTIVEKFGSLINSSFFDASNILGTLKLKGLVDFTTYVPGQNAITVTDLGKKLIEEADQKNAMPFDELDLAILKQLSTGKRSFADLGTAVNIRPKDLAMHLYKLENHQYITAEFRNGIIDIAMTEAGFMQANKGVVEQKQPVVNASQPAIQQPPPPPMQLAQAPATQQQTTTASPSAAHPGITNAGMQQPQQKQNAAEDKEIKEMQSQLSSANVKKSNKAMYLVAIIVIIVVIILVLAAKGVI